MAKPTPGDNRFVRPSTVARIPVAAGKSLLEGYVKTPQAGLCELIWNAFDEDATKVIVEIESNPLGGVALIRVTDDGNGMTRERAVSAFSRLGDSWKRSENGRPVHGKHGRGRYAAFSLGEELRWESTSVPVAGDALETIEVRGRRSELDHFDIEDAAAAGESRGTRVVVGVVSQEAAKAFDEPSGLRDRLLTEFALHLERHADFAIEFLGTALDPAAVIQARTKIPLELPEEVVGAAALTVIEWTLANVERRLYLCAPDGAILDEMPPGVQAVGAEFTAYLEWDGFTHDESLILGDGDESPAAVVVETAKAALREHLAASSRRREAETLRRWRSEGVYPYRGEPATAVEKATRDAFDLVAMAAARTVDDAKTRPAKGLALSLLKETFENNPEALLPILREVAKLPLSRIEELSELLERTTLTQLIALGKEVVGRVDFLQGLNAILFDKLTKKSTLERRQLHRILAHETWIFGEEWSLTGDDERLTEVLKKHLALVGGDVELATAAPIVREDGSVAIPDLVLGRKLETHENHFTHLVVELKRPNHTLTDEDVSQLRSYASAITNDERFDQPNSTWEFWLVGNDARASVDEQRDQTDKPYGVVQSSKKYTLIVKTWAEVIGDADHRLKFIQRSLQYESGRDAGLASMRDKYGDYLPPEAKASDALADGAVDEPADVAV